MNLPTKFMPLCIKTYFETYVVHDERKEDTDVSFQSGVNTNYFRSRDYTSVFAPRTQRRGKKGETDVKRTGELLPFHAIIYMYLCVHVDTCVNE